MSISGRNLFKGITELIEENAGASVEELGERSSLKKKALSKEAWNERLIRRDKAWQEFRPLGSHVIELLFLIMVNSRTTAHGTQQQH